jgi:thioredoxin-dependent peroxiredoxin
LKSAFENNRTAILGASFDTEVENAAFARKFDFTFPLLCDTSRAVGLAYGACDVPDAGFSRRISYLIGPDGTIARAYPKVDPKSHAGEVFRDRMSL